MTYAGFLLLFVVPPVLVAAVLCRGALAGRGWVPVVALLAIVYVTTTPWDAAAVARGIWGFDPDRLLGFWLFGLPVEELCFFGLQTLLTSIWVRHRLVTRRWARS